MQQPQRKLSLKRRRCGSPLAVASVLASLTSTVTTVAAVSKNIDYYHHYKTQHSKHGLSMVNQEEEYVYQSEKNNNIIPFSSFRMLQDEDLYTVEMYDDSSMIRMGQAPTEEDVTSFPSTHMDLTPTIAPVSISPELAPPSPPSSAPTRDPIRIIKQVSPLDFTVFLKVAAGVNLNDLLKDIEQFMESYISSVLTNDLETNYLYVVKSVSLTVTLLTRRRLRQRNLQTQITLEVEGSVQFEVDDHATLDLDVFQNQVELILEDMLEESRLQDALVDGLDAGGDVALVDVITAKELDQQDNDGGGGTTNPNTNDQQGGNPAIDALGTTDPSTRPSTLSIVFGFLLVVMATAGLFGYAYIFYRKRKKWLRKRKQMGQAGSPKIPKVSPRRTVAPVQRPQVEIPKEDSSDASSYKGLGSESDADVDDFAKELQMAASLDQAAWEHLQRKKHTIESNKAESAPPITTTTTSSSFSRDGIAANSTNVAMYDARSTTSGAIGSETDSRQYQPSLARSFPYGDEDVQEPQTTPNVDTSAEEGVEWTMADMGIDISDNEWEPYSSPTALAGQLVAGAPAPQWTTPSSKESRSIPQPYTTPTYSDNDNDEDDGADPAYPVKDSNDITQLSMIYTDETESQTHSEASGSVLGTSEIVMEVERLAKFVKRYEKKKERRLQRGRDRDLKNTETVILNPTITYDAMSDLESIRQTIENRERIQSKSSSLMNEIDDSVLEQLEQKNYGSDTVPGLHRVGYDEVGSVSETETESEDSPRRGEDISQRLGITPFSVQKPSKSSLSSFHPELSGGGRLSPKEGDRYSISPIQSVDSTEQPRQHRLSTSVSPVRRTAKNENTDFSVRSHGTLRSLRSNDSVLDGGGLNALRQNDAILDGTDSEINTPTNNKNSNGAINTTAHSRASDAPSDEMMGRIPKLNPPRSAPSKLQRKKIAGGGFSSLVNMFESKDKEAIFPPNQHWQYNS